jgi:hypothetical protein
MAMLKSLWETKEKSGNDADQPESTRMRPPFCQRRNESGGILTV